MTGASGHSGKREDGEQSASMLWLFGQFIMIPLAALVYGLELLTETMQRASRTATRGMEMALGDGLLGEEAQKPTPGTLVVASGPVMNAISGNSDREDVTTEKENMNMTYDGGIRRDRDLQDDMLKLVRYKILFVRRDFEHAFPEREDLVYDSMDGSAFAAWKVAEFIQELHKGETPVPPKWVARNYPEPKYVRNGKLIGLDDEDKKYLRVYYEVLERYVREKFYYEEQQIEILRKIAENMQSQRPGMSPAAPSGPAAGPAPGGGTSSGGTGSGAQTGGSGSGGSATTHVNPNAPGGGLGGPGPNPGY